jgi:hypothetical protein
LNLAGIKTQRKADGKNAVYSVAVCRISWDDVLVSLNIRIVEVANTAMPPRNAA